MTSSFNLDDFISKSVTGRSKSLFLADLITSKSDIGKELNSKSILVIGGAGSIGSSFIKEVLNYNVASLTVVDHNENGLTELTRDLRSNARTQVPKNYYSYPIDFGGNIFEKLLATHQYDVVACFAAHKHVRSEKDPFAIEAMFRNNIFNTKRILTLLMDSPPQHFFSVSTDKAANPVNIMGATKSLMEKVLIAYGDKMKITTARFANVAFSNGSLLDGFSIRLSKAQPLSAPMDVRRYFVSPQEAGQLCLLACLLGDSKDILFPKIDKGEMHTFADIAENFLFAHGLIPDFCTSEDEARDKASQWTIGKKLYPLYLFNSDTSGEKAYEEFYTQADIVNWQQFESIGVIKNPGLIPLADINTMLDSLEAFFINPFTKEEMISLISDYLEDFNHLETGRNLDQRM